MGALISTENVLIVPIALFSCKFTGSVHTSSTAPFGFSLGNLGPRRNCFYKLETLSRFSATSVAGAIALLLKTHRFAPRKAVVSKI